MYLLKHISHAPPLEHSDMYRDNVSQLDRRQPEGYRDHSQGRNEGGHYPRRPPGDRYHPRRPNDDRRHPRYRDDEGRNQPRGRNEREYPREPSAPPLEHSDMYRDNRGQQNRGPPRRFRNHPRDYNEDRYHQRDSPRHSRRPDYERNRPRASNEDRYRTGRPRDNDQRRHHQESNNSADGGRSNHELTSRYVHQEDRNEIKEKLENEAPPPSYDDVVKKYLKTDDV